MPEGDTLFRAADVLRRALLGERVTAARGRPGGALLARVVGARVRDVSTHGKHLLITFDDGLTLHTHLGMKGTWHRYAPGDRWRRDPARAVAVVETVRCTAVCFDASVVELLETRALAQHPSLARLGPDLLAQAPDLVTAVARLRAPERASLTIAEALLDQSAVAGLGNVYRSELLFAARIDPFVPAVSLDAEVLESLLMMGVRLLGANTGGGERVTMPDALGAQPGASSGLRARSDRWVYRRAGRPCRRCGTPVRSTSLGHPPRRLYWCPRCQGPPGRPPGTGQPRVPGAPHALG